MFKTATSCVGKPLSELNTPAFLIDRRKVQLNCSRMIERCRELKLRLRPHTKTHKTVEGAVLQTEGTKRGIMVCTLHDAEFYASHGFDDILYAFPLIINHIPRCIQLMDQLTSFHVLVDSIQIVRELVNKEPPRGKQWSVFIKIDAGNNRAGVWWEDIDTVKSIANTLHRAENVKFQGLYVHCGNTYHTQSTDEVSGIRKDSISAIHYVVKKLKEIGITCDNVGIGSTPSGAGDISDEDRRELSTLTEMHPGNYIFFDAQQESLGSCKFDDIAIRVMTRVIGHYPRRNQLLVDCGFTALTKQGFGALRIPGFAVIQDHPNLALTAMTQEIGKVDAIDGKLDFSKYPIGSVLFLYPYHACATAAMHPVYYVHENDLVVEEWYPTRGW